MFTTKNTKNIILIQYKGDFFIFTENTTFENSNTVKNGSEIGFYIFPIFN